MIPAAALVLWPWIHHPHTPGLGWAAMIFGALALTALFLPVRSIVSWAAAGATAAIFLCVNAFNGSMAWYTVGIAYSTRHWKELYWCKAFNLGALLQDRYGWEWADQINLADWLPALSSPGWEWLRVSLAAFGLTMLLGAIALKTRVVQSRRALFLGILPAAGLILALLRLFDIGYYLPHLRDPQVMPMRFMMVAVYTFTLLICAFGLTMHTRRRDKRFFFAMVAPWVLMFAILPQMQDRYLVWAAAFSAAVAAISIEGFLLHVLLTTINIINTADNMLSAARGTPEGRNWYPFVSGFFPDLAWGILLLAGVWLYLSLVSSRRRSMPVSS